MIRSSGSRISLSYGCTHSWSLKSPLYLCISITLPATLNTRITVSSGQLKIGVTNCGVRNPNTTTAKRQRVSTRSTQRHSHFETIVACTIGFCLIRQSSAGPIAIPRRARIGSVDAHNSVRYFNRPVDRSVTNLAIQFRLGILPKRRSRPGSRDIVDLRADGTCLVEWFKGIESERHLTLLGLRANIRSLFVTRCLLRGQLPCSTSYPGLWV